MADYKVPSMEDINKIPWNGYSVISSFSGCGGSCLGFRMTGFKTGAALEFIPQAARTYRANFKDVPVIEADIRDISGRDLLNKAGLEKGKVHVFEGSPPCLVLGQLVTMNTGYKPIEQVQIGDYVYTHMGRYRRVNSVMLRDYIGDVHKISVNGCAYPITVTPEHPLCVFRGGMSERGKKEPEWVDAEDLCVGDYIVYNTSNYDDSGDFKGFCPQWIDPKRFAKLLGYYMVAGYIQDDSEKGLPSMRVILHEKKLEDYVNDIIDCCKSVDRNALVEQYSYEGENYISIKSDVISTFCSFIGIKDNDRQIPEIIISQDKSILREFVKPLLYRCKAKNDNYFKPSSSLKLILGLQRIFLKLGCFTNVYNNTGKEEDFKYYSINILKREAESIEKDSDSNWFSKGNYAYLKVTSIETLKYDGLVYNLEVDEDNSYCSHIITTHNCSDFSSQRNSTTREKGKFKTYSDTKQRVDDLFLEYARMLDDISPIIFIAENVESILDENNKPYLDEFIRAMENAGIGYNVAVKKVDFSEYGVPQARVRALFIGIRKDMEMLPTFPAPNYRIVTTEDAIKDLIDMPADMEMTDLEKKYAKIIPYGAGADYIQMLRDVYNLKIMKFNHRRDTWNIPHPTLVQNTRHIHNLKNRWLTIAEAKRLAGFPDDFILTGSTTDQYERLGRAVPPIGMACFANHIKSIQDTLYDMGKIEIEKR